MATSKLISVIVPVYNGEEFLPEAIASIRAQAYAPLEIIVVDDGSTDRTAQVVQALGMDLRYIYQPNQGPAAARNQGLALARGELIAFLDADDLWPPHKLAHQVAALSADNDGAQMVWGTTQIQAYPGNADPLPPTATASTATLPSSITRLTPCVGSFLCRQAVFQQVGVFDPTLRLGEDLDWLTRVQESGIVMKRSPEVGVIYRLRSGSLTSGNHSLYAAGLFNAIKNSLARRRIVET